MIGVEATVIGFGLRGTGFGFGAGDGTELSVMVTDRFGRGFGGLIGVGLYRQIRLCPFFRAADFSSGFGSGAFPKTSAVVAAASSRAGMTIASSAGAGSLTGSGAVDFFARGLLAARSGRARSVRARAAYPRPARCARQRVGALAVALHFILKFLRLFLQITRLAFQHGFLGSGGGWIFLRHR